MAWIRTACLRNNTSHHVDRGASRSPAFFPPRTGRRLSGDHRIRWGFAGAHAEGDGMQVLQGEIRVTSLACELYSLCVCVSFNGWFVGYSQLCHRNWACTVWFKKKKRIKYSGWIRLTGLGLTFHWGLIGTMPLMYLVILFIPRYVAVVDCAQQSSNRNLLLQAVLSRQQWCSLSWH